MNDHLGSSRLLTDASGNVVWQSTFLPYGYEYSPQGSVNNYKFTGFERDSESGLDHAWFRQYAPHMGRWMSPDPAGLAAVDPTNPQTWNRYAYVAGNPINAVDPLGLRNCASVGPNGMCDAVGGQSGGGWGRGDSDTGTTYLLNGVEVDESFASRYLRMGSGVICFNGSCPRTRITAMTGGHYMVNLPSIDVFVFNNFTLSGTFYLGADWFDAGPMTFYSAVIEGDSGSGGGISSPIDRISGPGPDIIQPLPTKPAQPSLNPDFRRSYSGYVGCWAEGWGSYLSGGYTPAQGNPQANLGRANWVSLAALAVTRLWPFAFVSAGSTISAGADIRTQCTRAWWNPSF